MMFSRFPIRRQPAGTVLCAALALVFAFAGAAPAEQRWSGKVTDPSGEGLAGVEAGFDGRRQVSDEHGRFTFTLPAAGTYALELSAGPYSTTRQIALPLPTGEDFAITVDWPLVIQERQEVYAVSKRVERLVEAPAAVTSLLPSELASQSSAGQVPRLLEFTPGAQVAQSDLQDFNLNTRGFNSAINRRVLTLVDGRQTSVPEFLGVNEWGALSLPLDEFASVELVRGPGSALYGAGAFSGVLSLTTKGSQDTPGYRARLSGGELSTVRAEARVGGALPGSWHWRLGASHQESDHLTVSRVDSVEYEPDLLPRELIAPPFDKLRTSFASLRFDRAAEASTLTLEAGTGSFRGGTTIAPLGRTQADKVERPWARINFNTRSWNLLGFYSGRDGDNQIGLSSGAALYSEGYNLGAEVQGNRELWDGRGLLAAGLAHGRQRVDSRDPRGIHGIFAGIAEAHQTSAFAQLRFDATGELTLVGSARYDDSTLHSGRFSPRLALTWAPAPRHHLRLSYNDAFQSPTLVEFEVRTAVGPPVDLSGIPLSLGDLLGGDTLGFESVPQLALGNPGLAVEEIRAWELGYSAGFGSTFLAVNLYRNELENFTTSLLPQVGTSLGRLNPLYGPYTPPAGLSGDAASGLLQALQLALPPQVFAFLSNDSGGAPILAILSVTNFGEATAEGIEVEVSHFVGSRWQLKLSAASASYTVRDSPPENLLLPNAPELQAAASVIGSHEDWDGALHLRWVDGFDWSSGFFQGPVPSYALADLHLAYQLNDSLRLGIDVSNLTDHRHYQVFGGNLLRRRALLHLTLTGR
ncbi:MAG: TonB-dependent receptor [bacterium]|nr:TonB-dependent receptor [bacterium]